MNADIVADKWDDEKIAYQAKKWRIRNPQYAREFERLAENAFAKMQRTQEK